MEIPEQSSPQHEEGQSQDIKQEVVHTEGVIATSSEINVPEKLIDQVIGQENAVEVIKKAAVQRRHVMMIGSPGTGQIDAGQSHGRTPPQRRVAGYSCVPEF